jgi:hypothetical protein
MVMVLVFSVIDRGIKSWSSQAKDYKNDICCFSADLAALRSKSNKWLAQNQDKVSEWSATFCENVVEVFESMTTNFLMMNTPLFSGHLGTFDTLSQLQ